MSQSILYPPKVAEDSLESLYAAHGPRRSLTYWLILAGISGALIALPLVKVDVSIGASGVVRPAVERIVVQAAVDGNVKTLAVRDNQPVKKGDLLLELESKPLEEQIAHNRAQLSDLEQKLADLYLMIKTAQNIDGKAADRASGHIDVKQISTGLSPEEFHIPAYLREFELFLTQLDAGLLQQDKASREYDRFNALHQRGLVADQDLEQYKYNFENARAELQQLIRQAISRWQTDRLDLLTQQIDLRATEKQLGEQKELYTIRAPVDGTAMGFTGVALGSYVPAASRLGDISPSGELLIECYILPKDVGFIHRGLQAEVQVDAFPYTQWGTLTGNVKEISSDYVQVGQTPYFKAVVVPTSTYLKNRSGPSAEIRKGMTVNVRLMVNRRTLWQLLFQKANAWANPTAPPSSS